MTPMPVFLDVDTSIVEKNLRITKDDPAEEEFQKLFPTEKYTSKVVKPFPGFCIKTREVGTETKIFVNICYTDELPPPPQDLSEDELIQVWQSDTLSEYRIPMSIGDIRPESDKKGNEAKAIDVAINQTFFNKVQSSAVYKQFVMAVVFEGLSNKHSLHTTDDRITLKNCKAYGTLQLHRIQQRDVQQQMQTPLEELSGSSGITPAKPKIEMLSSVTYDGQGDKQTPEYRLFRKVGEPGFLYGEFRLLNILNASEVTLDIGEDRIIMESKRGGYFVDVFVFCRINQDVVEASFDKISKILTVKMGLKDTSKATSGSGNS